MDVSEPPRIVVESSARCPDGRRAEAMLNQVLAPARAPGHSWVVTMRLDAPAPGVFSADGEIKDDAGAVVGHRSISGKPGGDCQGLASAIGVWASLVLDGEMKRPQPVVSSAPDPASTAAQPTSELATATQPAAPEETPQATPTSAEEQTALSAPLAPGERASRHDDGHSFEVGAGGFLMTGTGGGVLLGATPFVLVELTREVFLRPALLFGASLPATDSVSVILAGGRLDGCLRVTGLYTNFHGIQLDVCGGTDVAAVNSPAVNSNAGGSVPYVAIGPSLDLRGELGGDFAVILRGLGSVNLVEQDSIHTPQWAGRAELAFSWRLR